MESRRDSNGALECGGAATEIGDRGVPGCADDHARAAAFAALYDRYRLAIHHYLYRLGGSWQWAEDLTQETFARAWRAWGRFDERGETETKAWLYRLATNLAIDELRRRQVCRFEQPVTGKLDDESRLLWIAWSPAPDEIAERNETRAAIVAALRTLPVRYQRALVVAAQADDARRAVAVAAALGISRGVAKSLLYRATVRLLEAYSGVPWAGRGAHKRPIDVCRAQAREALGDRQAVAA